MSEPSNLSQIRDAMPFATLIGVELLDARPDLVRGRLDFSQERCTAGGVIHGGALMALADTCGGICAFLNLPDGAIGTATIESKTNFIRAVREGPVTASTRPLHTGRTIIVLETEITSQDGSIAAKTTQTQILHHPHR